jgi:L-threonylcarbamoyladenylate synthase
MPTRRRPPRNRTDRADTLIPVPSRLKIRHAARVLRRGGIVAYPTEAVYGIGCLPLEASALDRIVTIKRRDARKGLIVVAADVDQLEPLAELPAGALGQEIRDSWPGPVTWVLPARPGLPAILTGQRATIAVRVSAHPLVRQLCLGVDSALVSTSANFSGHPPCRSALATRRALGPLVDMVLAGKLGDEANPTQIRDAISGLRLR